MKRIALIFCGMLVFSSSCIAQVPMQEQLKTILNNYLQKYHGVEHISAAAATISESRGKMMSAYAGTTEYGGQGKPIGANTLFQIGSISKSFTSVVILRLAAEGKLKLDDPVTKYFPQYKKWSGVTIRQLLDMTSGIPNYSEMPEWSAIEGQDIRYNFAPKQLVDMTYAQPMTKGYHYTNTGYILAGMIVAKVTNRSFAEVVRELIQTKGLGDTFYYPGLYPKLITDRMPSGYYYSTEDPNLNRLILSKADPDCMQGKNSTDLKCDDMSWAGAAGAVVASTEAVTRWARKLFTLNALLKKQQLDNLKSIVSYKNGLPIERTNAQDTHAFGLGVVQAYRKPIGNYWYYEGETLGYRTLYLYVPKSIDSEAGDGLIITVALNSQPVSCLDHIGELVMQIYQLTKANGASQ